MHTHIYIYTHTHTHTYGQLATIHMYSHLLICLPAYTHMYAHIYLTPYTTTSKCQKVKVLLLSVIIWIKFIVLFSPFVELVCSVQF